MEPAESQRRISEQSRPFPTALFPKRERFRYTIVRTHQYYTIQELGVQVHKNGGIREGYTPSLSPYRQAEIFETHETDPVKIVAAYKTLLKYRPGKKRRMESEGTAAGNKVLQKRWQILNDDDFLKGLAMAIKKSLPGGYLYIAANQRSFYVHWRQYNIRVSDHEQIGRDCKHGDHWQPNPKYGPEKYIGIILKIGKEEKACFLIGGGKLRIPREKIDKRALYCKVLEYLEHRGVAVTDI